MTDAINPSERSFMYDPLAKQFERFGEEVGRLTSQGMSGREAAKTVALTEMGLAAAPQPSGRQEELGRELR